VIEIFGPIAPSGQANVEITGFKGEIYFSTNSGFQGRSVGTVRLKRVEVYASVDKKRLVVVPEGGPIYASTNSGVAWVCYDAPGEYSVPISAGPDGMGFSVTITLGHKVPSDITKAKSNPTASPGSWYAMAVDNDENTVVVTGSASQSPPALSIVPNGNEVVLSWSASFSGYILQRNDDLTSTNWLDVTNSPTVVNGFYQVTDSSQGARKFYRLRPK
jgi:hypothetical protein